MRILVTGGAGFIASHVVDVYVRLGHEVAVVDNLSRGSRSNLNPRATFLPGDIRDRTFVSGVFTDFRPEVVNHHAAQMEVCRGVREPLFDASVNILGSLNLIEAAVAHQTRRFLYVSTAGAAYGEPQHVPVSEDAPIQALSPYGISKHTVEHYLFTFSRLYGLPYVVLRYANVYGPRQSSKGEAGVFAIFAEQMFAGIQPVIFGDGSKVRDYIFVDDIVRANVLALSAGQGEIFNIASGVPTTDQQVFDLVRDLLGQYDVRAKYLPRRAGEVERIFLDIRKAQHLLGWSPTTPLRDGARQTVAFFQQTAKTIAVAV
jgi:UDP-glucose 4-epimerase